MKARATKGARAALALAALAAATIATAPSSARAYCPCYTASSTHNTYNCGVEAAPGTNPTATEWQPIFALVAGGPTAWGSQGPAVGDIDDGCKKPMPITPVPARFPCEILKAIAMQESGWRQFCHPDTPADQGPDPERTIIAFDCGYGIGQVTSGMHAGETPSFDRARVASDPTYNLATGTLILADKWRATPCVGDNRVDTVEDWYYAVWAYNGFAYVNNPSNPNYDGARGVWDPNVGGAAPYQEKVWGWVEHPPAADYWPSVALAYPDRAAVGSSPGNIGDLACASPTDCNNRRPTHQTACTAMQAQPDMASPAPDDMAQPGGTDDLGPTPLGDGGAPRSDGAPARDASPHAGVSNPGCGCTLAARPPSHGGAWLAALALLLAITRRRPRR